ncbi:MAG: hypothetical protein J6S67_09545 [Methanobrevibacter sp.]|nr:hypothetical protein [Methanobrevibacter sp.]
MRIVIDIPDLDYFDIKHGYADNYQRERLVESVKRSIAIPKNHGRLIDAEQLMNYCQNQIDGHKYADCNVIARFPIVLDAEVEHDG